MKTYPNGMTSKECDTPGGGTLHTKQEGKREADINYILKNYERTGQIVNLPGGEPIYGDATAALEYDAALNLVQETREAFATWPSAVRDAAGNDPLTAMHMLQDEGGRAVLAAAGWAPVKRQTPESGGGGEALVTPATPPGSGVSQPN